MVAVIFFFTATCGEFLKSAISTQSTTFLDSNHKGNDQDEPEMYNYSKSLVLFSKQGVSW